MQIGIRGQFEVIKSYKIVDGNKVAFMAVEFVTMQTSMVIVSLTFFSTISFPGHMFLNLHSSLIPYWMIYICSFFFILTPSRVIGSFITNREDQAWDKLINSTFL